MAGPAIRRGDIWWTSFEGSVGGEIRKTRPAIVVSNDDANAILNRVQVIPLTSRVDKIYPCEALIQVDGRLSKAMADQIATADKRRLRDRVGRLSRDEMKRLEAAIRFQLDL